MYKGKDSKFGTKYYSTNYTQKMCRLRKEDNKQLDIILKDNNIGFTEFVKISMQFFKDKKIKKEYIAK